MALINPYLNFSGNTEEAFNFYKNIFGGEFTMIMRFGDTEHGANLSDEDKNKIMHIALPIGGNLLMATDCLTSMGHSVTFGNGYSISVHGDSITQSEDMFNALSAGGNVIMPFKKEFWGDHFGQLFDKFGVQWMVNFHDTTKS